MRARAIAQRWRAGWLVLAVLCATTPAAAAEDPSPATIFNWIEAQHRVFRRYAALVNQALHDYDYEYPTPRLLIPVIIDLYPGYIMRLHELEVRVLYPVLRQRMTEVQQRSLDTLIRSITVEQRALLRVTQAWEQVERGEKGTVLVEPLEAFLRLLNRHIVMQEEAVMLQIDALFTPQEQAAIVQQGAKVDQALFGRQGRRPSDAVFDAIEEQIRIVSPRKW